ncbi:MAG: anion transporter [Candidatus Goldbacteria bacterium]|nr:anion transporter [Candidatus Goldiibacteriota bacterium]
MHYFPVLILFIVFFLIIIRQIGNVKLQIWQIMLGGAVFVILSGSISIQKAVNSINMDVILFLSGMFIIGEVMEESGYLSHLTYKIFRKAGNLDSLLLMILFGMGTASAILMNDTIAIVGTPVVLLLAKNHRIPPGVLLLALAFAVTTGSVLSPIGNPQNLLIALHGDIKNPFVVFFKFLALPTILNLFTAFILIKIFYRGHFHKETLIHTQEPIKNKNLANLSRISLILILTMIGIKILTVMVKIPFEIKLTYISLISALPIIALSPRRFKILKRIDWATLVFFASMFILMQSVWDTGFFQMFLSYDKIKSLPAIFSISVILSQFISNVPLVALYLPLLYNSGAGIKELMALAAGSTIAGNMTILGAASNVIIIQNAEKKGYSVTFLEFVRIGIPLTVINVFIYWLFLH